MVYDEIRGNTRQALYFDRLARLFKSNVNVTPPATRMTAKETTYVPKQWSRDSRDLERV
jgi:hypothetical protein